MNVVSRRVCRSLTGLRSSYASGSASSTIFDVERKAAQRDRAAHLNPAQNDPLQVEVAMRVVERVEDCTRQFRRALILGGAGIAVVRALLGTPAGAALESVVVADHSAEVLARCRAVVEREQARLVAGDAYGRARRFESEYHEIDAGDAMERIGYTIQEDAPKFDLVVSCLHFHWVNDIPGVMSQCRELMAPDGFFLGAMLGGDTLQELRIACTLAHQERHGGVAPRTSPAVHVRDAGNLLTRAGFQLPAVDVDDVVVKYEDPLAVVEHLRSMAEQSSLKMSSPLSRDAALAAAAVYYTMFGEETARGEHAHEDGDVDGAVRRYVPATYQIIYMSGWSASDDQAKPRQRGSATVSFHDLENHFKADYM